MSTPKRRIQEFLRKNPGSKATEIAKALGVDRSSVNSVLHAYESKGNFQQDEAYRWSISDGVKPKSKLGSTLPNCPEMQEVDGAADGQTRANSGTKILGLPFIPPVQRDAVARKARRRKSGLKECLSCRETSGVACSRSVAGRVGATSSDPYWRCLVGRIRSAFARWARCPGVFWRQPVRNLPPPTFGMLCRSAG